MFWLAFKTERSKKPMHVSLGVKVAQVGLLIACQVVSSHPTKLALAVLCITSEFLSWGFEILAGPPKTRDGAANKAYGGLSIMIL